MTEQIKNIERQIFFLDMKDHWDAEDFKRMAELNAELQNLKAQI